MIGTVLLALAASAFTGGWVRSAPAQDTSLAIAAAADLKFAMDDLAAAYEKQISVKPDITYGSSGNFFSQIENGAPFDIFFSADLDYPRRLQATGLIEPGSLYAYAVGHIVLWAPPDSKIDLANKRWNALLDPTVQKISIANPDHAPYGRAAVAALKHAGIYEQIRTRLVYGENVSQAAQFAQSGSAQVGIIAESLALSPALKHGQCWRVPPDTHPPIEQAAVVLRNAKHKDAALRFLQFVKTASARAILRQHGFTTPASGDSP